MSDFHSVVTEQKVYICSVYSFIVRLLRAVLPEVAWNSALLLSEESLDALLDGVIRKNALEGANEGDCRLSMAQVACNSMKRLCDLLKRISESVGLKDVAERYLDAPWFIDMLYRKDTTKLNRLLYTIDFTDEKPSRLLMNVAAILDDKAVAYDGMSARAKRKADMETKELIREATSRIEKKIASHDADTKTQFAAMRDELHETKEQLIAKADEMLRKFGKANLGGKRKCRHTIEQKKVCLALWMEAQRNEELKSGTEKGIATYEAAFNWYKKQLALVGVDTLKKFIDVLNALKTKRSADQKAALEAKREAERKAKKNNPQTSPLTSSPLATKKPKCGKIHGMKKRTMRSLLAGALAVFGASAFGAVMPQLPEPTFVDTEVYTNVPCAQLLSDVREFETVLDFTGTASNCVQVAFGRDDDGNGDLSADETDVAIGWRAGDWFIEDVKGGRRFRESSSHGGAETRRLEFRVAAGEDGAKSASVVCDGAAKFGEALGGDLRWLYDRGWNRTKVTRRGVDSPGEIVLVASDHGGLKFIMR